MEALRISKTIILIGLLFLLILVLVILKITGGTSSSFSPTVPQPEPENTTVIASNITASPFKVTDSIKLTFSKPVPPTGLEIKLAPETPFATSWDYSGRELSIEPIDAWRYDTTYRLEINSAAGQKSAKILDKDYKYTFRTVPFGGI